MSDDYNLIQFAPEHWGTLERFEHFYSGTYSFDKFTQKALPGASNHFRKSLILKDVAIRQTQLLAEDDHELEKKGYTSAKRGKELSAIIEASIQELYSSIDCARKVVSHIYRNHRGMKQSTRKLFHAAKEGKIAVTVPEAIRTAFASADWYDDFRILRDQLTHSDVGFCHRDKNSGKIAYLNGALGNAERAFVIPDILAYFDELVKSINKILGEIFNSLNQSLNDKEMFQFCGIFSGRVYSRMVKPSEAVDFNSGRCSAYVWFEKEDQPVCPFKNTCGAYLNRTPSE